MIYLKDYSKLEECISEEINKESSLLQSIYKETGKSKENRKKRRQRRLTMRD